MIPGMQLASITPAPLSNAATPVPDMRATFREYTSALFAPPGVVSVGWGINRPDTISLSVQNAELALLADRVLADSIDGVKLLITSRTDTGEVPADSWVRNRSNVARAMAALPGVVDWLRFGGITLLADSRERVAWLRKVVSADIDGTPVRIMLREDLP